MRYLKKKGDESTIRKVVNDDRTKVLAVVGTIQDLMDRDLLRIEGEGREQYSRDTYMCIPVAGYERCAGFGATKEEAVSRAVFRKEA